MTIPKNLSSVTWYFKKHQDDKKWSWPPKNGLHYKKGVKNHVAESANLKITNISKYCLICTSVEQLWWLSASFSLFSIVTNWCFHIKWRHINLLLCKIFFSLFLAFRSIIYPALIRFPDITLSSNSHSPIQIKYIINQPSPFRAEFKWKFSCLSAHTHSILSTIY